MATETTYPTGRPGFPRSQPVPPRITLRLDAALYDQLEATRQRLDLDQREIVEPAIKEELRRKPKPKAVDGKVPIKRTGMWIDQALLEKLDARLTAEGSSQRAFIEHALRRKLAKLS